MRHLLGGACLFTNPFNSKSMYILLILIILTLFYIIYRYNKSSLRYKLAHPVYTRDFKLTAPLVWPGSLYVRVSYTRNSKNQALLKGIFLLTNTINFKDQGMDILLSDNFIHKLNKLQIQQLESIITFC